MIPGPLHAILIAEPGAAEDQLAGAAVAPGDVPLLTLEAPLLDACPARTVDTMKESDQLIDFAVVIVNNTHFGTSDDSICDIDYTAFGDEPLQDDTLSTDKSQHVESDTTSPWYVWLLVALVVLCWGGAASIYSVASKYGSNSAAWTSAGLSFGQGVGYIGLALFTIMLKKGRLTVAQELVAEVREHNFCNPTRPSSHQQPFSFVLSMGSCSCISW
jgi:hypothetical protein